MTTKTKTNGYEAKALQHMINAFETACFHLFPDAEIEHFYYGDGCDMVDVKNIHPGRGFYGNFVITSKSVHFTGHTCTTEEYNLLQMLCYNDDCYPNGKLFALAI